MNRVMSDFCRQVVEVARQHGRFNPEAYLFIFHSLRFAQEELGFGGMPEPTRGVIGPGGAGITGGAAETPEGAEEEVVERHITPQQLCEAIRQLALREFGYMAKTVFKSWGITQTGDFGAMVFQLIEGGLMKKTDRDRLEDFANVFDFETGLSRSFRMELPEEVE